MQLLQRLEECEIPSGPSQEGVIHFALDESRLPSLEELTSLYEEEHEVLHKQVWITDGCCLMDSIIPIDHRDFYYRLTIQKVPRFAIARNMRRDAEMA